MRSRLNPLRLLAMALAPALLLVSLAAHAEKPAVLIVHGQNNHDNDRTAAALRSILESTGRFELMESRTPAAFERPPRRPPGDLPEEQKKEFDARMADHMKRRAEHEASAKEEWAAWTPDFAAADVVVLSYNGEAWPREVEQKLEDYVSGGGKLVNVHAANNPFPDWEAFNQMIGLGWRGAEFGFRVTVNEDGSINRIPPGEGPGAGHGEKHVYPVRIEAQDHPITRLLPGLWMHAYDELYHGQRGPAENMNVLASAFNAEKIGGTGEREPLLWVIPFGDGLSVTNLLGHLGRDQQEMDALYCVGFQTIFARSVEWCATGEVTLPVPESFPGQEEPVVREPMPAMWKN